MYSNFNIKSVPGDGNCQYHCIEYFIGGGVQNIRENVYNEINSFSNEYKPFLDETISFDEYVSKILDENEWGDNFTLKAISESYRLLVNVYNQSYNLSTDPNLFITDKSPLVIECKNPRQIINILYDGYHYNILLDKTSIDTLPDFFNGNLYGNVIGIGMNFDDDNDDYYDNDDEYNDPNYYKDFQFKLDLTEKLNDYGGFGKIDITHDEMLNWIKENAEKRGKQIYLILETVILDFIFEQASDSNDLIFLLDSFLGLIYEYCNSDILMDYISNMSWIDSSTSTLVCNLFFSIYNLLDYPKENTEDIIIKWYNKRDDSLLELKRKLVKFITWLETASENDDSDS
jgi:hypothetical protein